MRGGGGGGGGEGGGRQANGWTLVGIQEWSCVWGFTLQRRLAAPQEQASLPALRPPGVASGPSGLVHSRW